MHPGGGSSEHRWLPVDGLGGPMGGGDGQRPSQVARPRTGGGHGGLEERREKGGGAHRVKIVFSQRS